MAKKVTNRVLALGCFIYVNITTSAAIAVIDPSSTPLRRLVLSVFVGMLVYIGMIYEE